MTKSPVSIGTANEVFGEEAPPCGRPESSCGEGGVVPRRKARATAPPMLLKRRLGGLVMAYNGSLWGGWKWGADVREGGRQGQGGFGRAASRRALLFHILMSSSVTP